MTLSNSSSYIRSLARSWAVTVKVPLSSSYLTMRIVVEKRIQSRTPAFFTRPSI